jgi:hypothetical protein
VGPLLLLATQENQKKGHVSIMKKKKRTSQKREKKESEIYSKALKQSRYNSVVVRGMVLSTMVEPRKPQTTDVFEHVHSELPPSVRQAGEMWSTRRFYLLKRKGGQSGVRGK